MKIFTCEICHADFGRYGNNIHPRFCSRKCKAEFQHKYLLGKNHPRWNKDFIREKICSYCGNKFFPNKNPSHFQRKKFCSKLCADLGGFRYRGKEHPNWRGIKSDVDRLRASRRYKEWSRDVMNRDDFTCLICKKRGGDLHAHHIQSFTNYPQLRFELHNGITLCVSCHAKLHRPKKGSKFSGVVENGVNSVELPMGQYRAKPEKEGVEVSPEIMDIKTLSAQRAERYDPSQLVTVGSEK